jgi:hypothetical protein
LSGCCRLLTGSWTFLFHPTSMQWGVLQLVKMLNRKVHKGSAKIAKD